MRIPHPHDLLWLNHPQALESVSESWVAELWQTTLPVVVRRDRDNRGRIPVGIRGIRRDQRAAGWIWQESIVRVVAPETLAQRAILSDSPFVSMPPVRAALLLAEQDWPWCWGITGSTGYALATDIPVLHAASDLDLLIRCPQPVARDEFKRWQQTLNTLPCRADTQIETPHGAFALTEWLREGRFLMKTARGPHLVSDPWNSVEEA